MMPSVSAVVLTKNGAGRLERCLNSIQQTNFADELVVCVDRDTTDESVEVARSFTQHVHMLETGGYVESVLPEMAALCSGDFVLRIDDDEAIAGTWDKEQFQLLVSANDVTHVLIPCRWIVPPGNAFISNYPWFPDLHLRLFWNNPRVISWPSQLHEPMRMLGRSLMLFDRWIEHFNLVLTPRTQRERKCDFYRSLRPDHDLSQFYLCDERNLDILPSSLSGSLAATSFLAARETALKRHVRPYRLGTVVDFRAQGNATEYTVAGWSQQENWGIWTKDREADICLPLDAPIGAAATLTAELAAYVTAAHPVLRVDVCYAGVTLGEWSFDTAAPVRKSVSIPGDLIAQDQRPCFLFRVLNPASPAELGESDDSRRLGLGFRSLCLERD